MITIEDLMLEFSNCGIDLSLVREMADWALTDYDYEHRLIYIPMFKRYLSSNGINVDDDLGEKLYFLYQDMVDSTLEWGIADSGNNNEDENDYDNEPFKYNYEDADHFDDDGYLEY